MTPDESPQLAEYELVNLTPHPVTILTPAGPVVIRNTSTPARLRSDLAHPHMIAVEGQNIPVFREVPLPPVGVPEHCLSRNNRLFIVSRTVAERFWWRHDLVFPSQLVHDPATGKVVACSSLSRLWIWGER